MPPADQSRTLHQSYETLAAAAVGAALTWLDHPVARELVRVARGELIATVMAPIHELVTTREETCLFLSYCLGIVRLYETGPERPTEFEQLLLTHPDPAGVAAAVSGMRMTLIVLAGDLERRGVPLDGNAPANWYILGQLLLNDDIDIAPPAKAWIDDLDLMPVGSFNADGNGLDTSRHATRAAIEALEHVRSVYRDDVGLTDIPAPYSHGRQRRPEFSSRRLTAAFEQLVHEFPNATVSTITSTWRGTNDSTHGGRLRHILEGGYEDIPSRSCMYRYLRAAQNERHVDPS